MTGYRARVYPALVMAGDGRRHASRGRAAPARPPAWRPDATAPGFRVVLVPPATPEEEEDAERRWIEAVEWLVTLGALDG